MLALMLAVYWTARFHLRNGGWPLLLAASLAGAAAVATKWVAAPLLAVLVLQVGMPYFDRAPGNRRNGRLGPARAIAVLLLPWLIMGLVAVALYVTLFSFSPPTVLADPLGALRRGFLGLPIWIGLHGLF